MVIRKEDQDRYQTYEQFIRDLLKEIRNPLIIDAFVAIDINPFLPSSARMRSVNTNEIFTIRAGPGIEDAVTLSQRLTTALMIEHLRPTEKMKVSGKVLEIGTGSGYLSAVLSKLYREVHTIEQKPAVSQQASRILYSQGYRAQYGETEGVTTHIGDGALGLPAHGLYDAIIYTAALKAVPAEVIAQLALGGRLVAPVGSETFNNAYLAVVTKNPSGAVQQRRFGKVYFLPVLTDATVGWTPEEARKRAELDEEIRKANE